MGYLHVSICMKSKYKKVGLQGVLSNFLSVFDKSFENIIWLKLIMGLLKTLRNVDIAGVCDNVKSLSQTQRN